MKKRLKLDKSELGKEPKSGRWQEKKNKGIRKMPLEGKEEPTNNKSQKHKFRREELENLRQGED